MATIQELSGGGLVPAAFRGVIILFLILFFFRCWKIDNILSGSLAQWCLQRPMEQDGAIKTQSIHNIPGDNSNHSKGPRTKATKGNKNEVGV